MLEGGELRVDEEKGSDGQQVIVLHFKDRALKLGAPTDISKAKAKTLLNWWKGALVEHHAYYTRPRGVGLYSGDELQEARRQKTLAQQKADLLDRELADLKIKYDELEARFNDRDQDNGSLYTRLEKSETEYELLRQHLEISDAEAKRQKDLLEEALQLKRKTELRWETSEQNCNDLREELEREKVRNEDLEDRLRMRNEDLEDRLRMLGMKMAREYELLKSENELLKSENDTLLEFKREVGELQDENRKLRSRGDSAESANATLEEELRALLKKPAPPPEVKVVEKIVHVEMPIAPSSRVEGDVVVNAGKNESEISSSRHLGLPLSRPVGDDPWNFPGAPQAIEGTLLKQNKEDSWQPGDWNERFWRMAGPILSYDEKTGAESPRHKGNAGPLAKEQYHVCSILDVALVKTEAKDASGDEIWLLELTTEARLLRLKSTKSGKEGVNQLRLWHSSIWAHMEHQRRMGFDHLESALKAQMKANSHPNPNPNPNPN